MPNIKTFFEGMTTFHCLTQINTVGSIDNHFHYFKTVSPCTLFYLNPILRDLWIYYTHIHNVTTTATQINHFIHSASKQLIIHWQTPLILLCIWCLCPVAFFPHFISFMFKRLTSDKCVVECIESMSISITSASLHFHT